MGLVPFKEKEEIPELSFSVIGGHSTKVAIHKPGRDFSPGTKSAGI